MLNFIRDTIVSQFEASLYMLNECIEKCPADQWDAAIGKYPFWHVAYHTLCLVDLYLTSGVDAFHYRPEFHPKRQSEFDGEHPSRRFDKSELVAYLAICRQKLIDKLAAETAESLQGPSGFPWLRFSRAEAHLYNLRHVQHHTGQLSAHLRRVDPMLQDPQAVRWIGAGWR